MSYRLEVEYDGTDFKGWQIQKAGRTVQGELESALAKLFEEPVVAVAAGRTDAGVHATGQVAHFRTHNFRPVETVQRALNALLPKDIHIKSMAVVPSDFHARFGARWRRYKYILATQPSALWRRFLWYPRFGYDFTFVLEATPHLLGRHDFASFCLSGSDTETTHCEVYQARWEEQQGVRTLDIVADRFLRGMVRLIVGTLLEVGRGRFPSKSMSGILEAKSVARAGPLAPPQGLTLVEVGYTPWTEPSNAKT
ncbi:MAG: tRNA pseudouridine(38-40) synthase TruA [bacterium]